VDHASVAIVVTAGLLFVHHLSDLLVASARWIALAMRFAR